MPLMRLRILFALVILAAVGLTASPAEAGKKKYHYSLTKVLTKPETKADLAKVVATRVEAMVKKAFGGHPQLVINIDGAPDPKANADGYKKFLAKKGIAGAYTVTVDITEASEELVPVEGKPNSQRLVIKLALHLLGEAIPAMTMAFSGDGQATIKQEVGKKVREKDREFSWDEAAKLAVDDAIAKSIQQVESGKFKAPKK
jgi:hypothetical protein